MTRSRPAQLAGCKNGPCPKIFRWGDRAAVQGMVDTALTSHVAAGEHEVVVEIPVEILIEALGELGEYGDVISDSEASGGPEVGPLARRVGAMVVVRGCADTDLTRQIVPGSGELVVEVPLALLAARGRELEVA